MTNKKMEQRLASALEKTAPDDVCGVLSRCEVRKGTAINMTTKKTDKENMAHTRRCLSCGDTAGRRRTVLSAGECSCVRGVAGCQSQHRTEAQQE